MTFDALQDMHVGSHADQQLRWFGDLLRLIVVHGHVEQGLVEAILQVLRQILSRRERVVPDVHAGRVIDGET